MPRHLLFITNTRIGDAVLSTGILDALLRDDPALSVTVATGPLPAQLFEATPRLERIIALTKRPRGGHWVDLWKMVAGTRWHRVVDLRRSLMPWMVWARHRHSVGGDSRHAENGQPKHRVVLNAEAIGRGACPPAPVLWTRPKDEAAADSLLAGVSGAAAGAPVLAVAPTANWRGKEWPADRWVALLDRLTGTDGPLADAPVAVLAGPSEQEAVAPVLAAVPEDRRIDLTRGAHLLTIAALLRRCRLFIGNDSGLMHIAASSGAPTVGLFGPTDERRYGPWGAGNSVVRTPEDFEHWRRIMVAPGFDSRTTPSLMTSLTVDAVAAEAERLLEGDRLPVA
ncbi:ADP-heptose--lipooligosaccharide heptosyltransferase II [Caenispirillum salinarum AK4]|uniref:ADP-heptose--lipooligosaccharide heptosyltransferase II n=1 Tax=Caenispirillum salinarum AK4 TaxID=1238182 RepID=K9HFE4_9PROT|nr:glycosyltransferase family 9 protein [Caenispirillum salinarum]EKV27401.1 ADP-heptose--lipooligosaccharide heptosyltransferase II [Caenispirillum salinarum AK4]